MALLGRMPMGGMVGQLDPRMLEHLGQGAAIGQQAMQPPAVDPSLAAYGQTQNGQMPDMQQGMFDNASLAYNQGFSPDMKQLGAIGGAMMQQSQPQIKAPPPPQQLDPYRFRRR